jgi:hypothetical protein
MPETTVTVTGPLFNGAAARASRELCDAIEYSVAWQAHAEARQIMDASFKHPTPYYEVQVTVQRLGDAMVVHDRGIAYGPWLESGASRRPSKFRGYHSFRRATAAVLPKIPGLVARILPQFVKRMNR